MVGRHLHNVFTFRYLPQLQRAQPYLKTITNDPFRLTAWTTTGLSNLYNPSDYVLRKAGFPRRFGVTTLGCNCKQESDKLDTYFEEHFPRSVYEDFPARDIGSAHAFTRYVESGAFVTTCRFLYELDLGKP